MNILKKFVAAAVLIGCVLASSVSVSAGTAEIVKLADGDLSRTNVFAKIAIRQILKLSVSELPKKLTIPFELELEKIRYGS